MFHAISTPHNNQYSHCTSGIQYTCCLILLQLGLAGLLYGTLLVVYVCKYYAASVTSCHELCAGLCQVQYVMSGVHPQVR